MIRNDWYDGFKNRKWMYVLLLSICGFLSLLISMKFTIWIENGRVDGDFSIVDMLMYWFKGSLPIQKKDFSNIDISEYYLFMIIGIASLVGNYIVKDLNGYGIQVITRVGKVRWVISKIVWNVVSVMTVFAMVLITSYLICLIHPHGNAGFGWNTEYAKILGYDLGYIEGDKINLLALEVMPLFSAFVLAMYQMLVSLIFSPVISYILVVLQMILCMFYSSPFLPGNGYMFIKTHIFYKNGTSPIYVVIISIAGWLISVMIVFLYVKYMDILQKEKV